MLTETVHRIRHAAVQILIDGKIWYRILTWNAPVTLTVSAAGMGQVSDLEEATKEAARGDFTAQQTLATVRVPICNRQVLGF